jgi:uncharacterized damage-inducible protein DinB
MAYRIPALVAAFSFVQDDVNVPSAESESLFEIPDYSHLCAIFWNSVVPGNDPHDMRHRVAGLGLIMSTERVMAMIEHMQRLFSYDDWANHEVLTSLLALQVAPPRSVKLLAHIFSAERLWYERLQLQKQTYPVWPDFSLEHCKLEARELQKLWGTYLHSLKEDALTRLLSYKNTKGEGFESSKQDILMHVILHSAYHRGQIAADIRAAGFVPPYTDFIHAARQGFIEDDE